MPMTAPLVAIVSSNSAMRQALQQCISRVGYSVLALPPQQIAEHNCAQCTLSIVDLNPYPGVGAAEIPEVLAQLPALYLDSPLPKQNEQQRIWARQIAAKVACMQAQNDYGNAVPSPVWLLLASAGGPEAVSAFIDNLPEHCPVGFLYGQHINPGFETNLVAMLHGRRGFTASLGKTGQRLAAGEIIVAPSGQRLSLLAGDTLMVEDQAWPGRFQPSLDALAVEFSHRPKNLGGVVIFSGMGEDGAKASRLYAANGGTVWAQEPSSCVVSAMPDAALATHSVSYCGQPSALAHRLAALYCG